MSKKIKNIKEIQKAIKEFPIKDFMESIVSSSHYSIKYSELLPRIVFYPMSENKKQSICVYLPSMAIEGGLYHPSEITWSCSEEFEDNLSAEIFGLCLVLASRVSRNINNHFDKLIEEEEG